MQPSKAFLSLRVSRSMILLARLSTEHKVSVGFSNILLNSLRKRAMHNDCNTRGAFENSFPCCAAQNITSETRKFPENRFQCRNVEKLYSVLSDAENAANDLRSVPNSRIIWFQGRSWSGSSGKIDKQKAKIREFKEFKWNLPSSGSLTLISLIICHFEMLENNFHRHCRTFPVIFP